MLIVACGVIWATYPVVRAEQLKPRPIPALYPSARNVEEKVVPRGGEGYSGDLPMRVVSFNTAGRPEDVLAYYLNRMTRAGWRHWETTEEKYRGDAYFGYFPGDAPTYRVNVRTSILSSGQTAVTMEIFAVGGDWHGDTITENSR